MKKIPNATNRLFLSSLTYFAIDLTAEQKTITKVLVLIFFTYVVLNICSVLCMLISVQNTERNVEVKKML